MENDTEKQVLIEWLRSGLKEGNKSKGGLALALGQHPSVVSKMLKGLRNVDAVELATIAEYLGKPLPSTLFSHSPRPEPVSKKLVRVTRVAAVGVWREREGEDVLDQSVIFSVPEPKLKGIEQFAVRLEGTSRYAVFVPFDAVRVKPRNGDIVVLDRLQGELVETTIRRVEIDQGVVKLVNHDNIHSTMKPLAYPVDQNPDDLRFIGLCIGFWERLEL